MIYLNYSKKNELGMSKNLYRKLIIAIIPPSKKPRGIHIWLIKKQKEDTKNNPRYTRTEIFIFNLNFLFNSSIPT